MVERAKQKETELDKTKRIMMETGMVLSTVTMFIPFELNLDQS